MAYNDYQMGGYIPGDYETEEERRRRLEQEQAQYQTQDLESGGITAQRPGTGFMDMAGRYVDNRIGAAQQRIADVGQMFEDPEAALQRRMGLAVAEQPVEPTPVKQTITTDPRTGEQKMTISGSVQDLTAANPLTPTVSQPVTPGQAVAQDQQAQAQQLMQMPDAQQREQAAVERMRAAAAVTQPPPEAAPAGPSIPQGLVAGGGVPARADIGQVPTPGPAVQVAVAPTTTVTGQTQVGAPRDMQNLAQGGAQAAAAPTPAPAPAEPAWVAAANAAGNDFDKLIGVLAKHPEAEKQLKEKLFNVFEGKKKAEDAAKMFKAAENGDLKAWNKIQQEMRPERGKQKEEITVGDYVRAAVYARMGLTDLAQQAQAKILGKDTKFGQIQLGGTNWNVEQDAKTGELVRAQDDDGNVATKSTLNKLAASGLKTGTQAFNFTGGIHTVPKEDGSGIDLVMPIQNQQGGTAGFTYMSGPNKGKEYTGKATPQPQSIGTAAAKAEQGKQISLAYDPIIEAAKKGAGFLGEFNAKNGTNFGIVGTSNGVPVIVDNNNNTVVKKNDQGVVTTTSNAGAGNVGLTGTGNARGKTPAEIEQNMALGKKQAEARIEANKEVDVTERKPPAEAKGKIEAKDINNQQFANSTYDLVKPIADLIKKSTGSGIGAGVDTLAGKLGAGTQGAAAIAELEVLTYPLISNVPRFEGPQGVRDVELYERAAGDLANNAKPVRVRLAALNAMLTMLKKYDKAGTNDWTFGAEKPASEIKIISREKAQ